jgi:nucleotide-binding universal stress UspA family protein
MVHHILAALDGGPDGDRVARTAVALARRDRARLTLLGTTPAPPAVAHFCPQALALFDRDAVAATEAQVTRALTTVPPDVSVTWLLRRLPTRAAILRQLHDGGYDLVVTSPCRRRARRRADHERSRMTDAPEVRLLVIDTRASTRRATLAMS